jgi:hypothetical protein
MDLETNSSLVEKCRNYAAGEGVDVAEGYTVTTVIPYTDEYEIQEYELTAQEVEEMAHGYSQTGEIIVNIEPRYQ